MTKKENTTHTLENIYDYEKVDQNKKELNYIVYVGDFNSKKIKRYNIFSNYGFMQAIYKVKKDFEDSFENFSKKIREELSCYFRSRCEYEIILSDWPPSSSFTKEKVDVYSQVMLNWDIFIKYLWDNKKLIKKR